MKKILEHLVCIITIVAIILAGAEEPDGSMDIQWTLACLCIAAICAVILNVVFGYGKKKEIQAPDK